MSEPVSTIHQIIGTDGAAYPATGCFNLWVGNGPDVFAFPREGNTIQPLTSGKAYFADLIRACDQAADSGEVLIIGWQVNWDALLAPGVRLYDLIYRHSKRGVKFYVMPWNDTNPVQTYDDETRAVLESINARLGLEGTAARVHVQLSRSFASTNVLYYSHHQKCVIVDRKIAYVGGIDLAYGRYDDDTFGLRADADGREVLNRYNPGIPWLKPLKESEVVDPDLMTGVVDQNLRRTSLAPTEAERASAKVKAGAYQIPYQENSGWNGVAQEKVGIGPIAEQNPVRLETLDERIQPRMPWQDVHARIEGPAVIDLVRNFAQRWNIGGKPLLAVPSPKSADLAFKPGTVSIQVLRSAPAQMRQKEYRALKNKADFVAPQGTDASIEEAMVRLIDNAAYFLYIENQFFVSDFGEEAPFGRGEQSPAAQFISAFGGQDQEGTASGLAVTLNDADSHIKLFRNGRISPHIDDSELLNPPTNRICPALIKRIRKAIFQGNPSPFHVYITLPVHPEGSLANATVVTQIYWTMQTLVFGSHSLLNGIRRALKAKQLADAGKPYQAVLDNPRNTEHEEIPFEACYEYVTLLNLRNWEKLGDHYVTEQIYGHTKMMIADDRFALFGSANINDRSLLGERDSEIAVLVMDNDKTRADIGLGRQTPVRSFARELRMQVWKKLFGITGNVRPATHLQTAIEQPANPASWKAIQKQAEANAEAYEKAFEFVPRSWTARTDPDTGRPISGSVLPTWDTQVKPPPEYAKKWSDGFLKSPMPFQKEFWSEVPAISASVNALSDIKGFFSALPIHWTEEENIQFSFPTSLVTKNERSRDVVPRRGDPTDMAWNSPDDWEKEVGA